MKRPIIAGNWKMNMNNAETKALLEAIGPLVKDAKCEVVVCVPFTSIDTARKAIRGTKIKLGAQNVHWAPKGAFTGEISADMLKELKVRYVGETLEQREAGQTKDVVIGQLVGALEGIEKNQLKRIVIAYEPVWAIGTGKTATAEEANATIRVIRKGLRKLYDRTAAKAMRIQYGGSMNAKNASELMAMPEIDGGLIGGASLKAEDFAKVVNY